jgi:hypothetical protein
MQIGGILNINPKNRRCKSCGNSPYFRYASGIALAAFSMLAITAENQLNYLVFSTMHATERIITRSPVFLTEPQRGEPIHGFPFFTTERTY